MSAGTSHRSSPAGFLATRRTTAQPAAPRTTPNTVSGAYADWCSGSKSSDAPAAWPSNATSALPRTATTAAATSPATTVRARERGADGADDTASGTEPRRREDPADGRGQLAALTDEGLELLAGAAPGHVAAVRRVVFDALSPEQVEQLAGITAAMVSALKQADEEDAYPSALPWHRR